MGILEELDIAIKRKETGRTDGAYLLFYRGNWIERTGYMSNAEWAEFVEKMPKQARDEYEAGDGGELIEQGYNPPKMASYGSSSRLIYLLSKEIVNFRFERKLPTTIGPRCANLDGFCEYEDRQIFVEAKRREPYYTKNQTVGVHYKKLYAYLDKQAAGGLRIDTSPNGKGGLDVAYFAKGEKISRFDVKQMISHLLAIATGMLQGTVSKKRTEFVYLLYDPTSLDLSPKNRQKITEIYQRTCFESTLIDFSGLFGEIVRFLIAENYPEKTTDDELAQAVKGFSFAIVSQDEYPSVFQ